MARNVWNLQDDETDAKHQDILSNIRRLNDPAQKEILACIKKDLTILSEKHFA